MRFETPPTITNLEEARVAAARRVALRRAITRYWPGCPFDLINLNEQQLRNLAALRNIPPED